MKYEKILKVVTYNIDGLPEKLDLSELPWILKPIAWIYKLIKGTYEVIINDGQNKDKNIKQISKYLASTDADIIGVQEDFNYHDDLMSKLDDDYEKGYYAGGFDVSKFFSSTDWLSHFPLPRFKADGLNVITKKSRITNIFENIIPWKKSYGYVSHANDVLTKKGFRHYILSVDNEFRINVYIVHMDADFYHPEKCPDVSKDIEARESQFKQLAHYITVEYPHYNDFPIPSIVIGDTNSAPKYKWDEDNININFIHEIQHNNGWLHVKEAIPENFKDVDRIFYINNDMSEYKIEVEDCYYDFSANESEVGRISDHKPFVAKFKITKQYE